MLRREFVVRTGTIFGGAALSQTAMAEQTVRIVVGFAAGGPGDILARFLAEQLKKASGDNVIVDNKPGAAGRIAINLVKGAEGDGTTMLNSPASLLTLLPHAVKAGDFNPLQDLIPVGGLADLEFALVVGAKVQAKNLSEYLVLCRSDPKLASFGTAGAGTPQHMLGALLGRSAGITLTHIAYRGGAPALQDVIAGVSPAAIGSLSDLMLTSARDGRIRILATSGTKRSAFLPDVPTMLEAGLKDVSAADCSGILMPARTPAAVVNRFSRLLFDIVSSSEFRAGLNRFYMEPLPMESRAYAERLKAEYNTWGPLVKASGFSLDA